MPTKQNRILSGAICLLLCIAMLIGVCPVTYATTDAPLDPDILNFGIANAENNITLSPSTLFSSLYPTTPLSDAERAYLDENLFSLTYNNVIPSDAVQTLYHKETGILDVTVPVYTYTASNGTVVSWVPQSASIGGNVKPLTLNGEHYVCSFEGLENVSEDFDMTVSFAWDAAISEEVSEIILTQSKKGGEEATLILEQYAASLAQYNQTLDAYNRCVKYEQDKKLHAAYLRELSEYQAKKAEYDAYVEAKNLYDAQLQAYNDYQTRLAEYKILSEKYDIYTDFMNEHGDQVVAYMKYDQQMKAVLAKLRVMEMLFVCDSHKWQVYGSIMGGTVSTVLDRKDELASLGAEKVDEADEATKALRALLGKPDIPETYAYLRGQKYSSEFEKNRALYEFYCTHYEELRANFKKLYQALFVLYCNGLVIQYSEAKGQGEHFKQFIAQLYVIYCCLDNDVTMTYSDNPLPPSNFKGVKLTDLLEECHLLVDNVSAPPGNDTYPDKVVPEIIAPEKVEDPGDEPERVFPPDEDPPEEVANPGDPPPVVDDPGDTPPPATEHPGEPPVHGLSDTMVQWATAYKQVNYTERQALVKDTSLRFETSMIRSVSIDNKFKIAFYGYDGTQLGETQYLHLGDPTALIQFPTFSPRRENTAQYRYAFRSWTLFNGEDLTESTVTSDISFIARYDSAIQTYTVKWEIDGQVERESLYEYGQTPFYETPDVKVGIYNNLVFSGWSPEVTPVTGNITYQGFYTAVPRYYNVTWVLDKGARIETVEYIAGQRPVYMGNRDFIQGSYLYTFSHWMQEIKPLSGDVTYEAVYNSGTPLSVNENGSHNETTVSADAITVYTSNAAVMFSTLAKNAIDRDLDLILRSHDAGVLLTTEALQALKDAGCGQILFSAQQEEAGRSYNVDFLDIRGKSLGVDVPMTLLCYYTAGSGGISMCYRNENGAWNAMECSRSGGVMRAKTTKAGRYWIGMEYYLRFSAVSNCNTLALPVQAAQGHWIDLGAVKCHYGYEITGAILKFADGTQTTVTDGFAMPAGTVTVELWVERIVYNVSFVVDGKVIENKTYYLGDVIECPTNPTLDKGDGYIYTFTGWSPHVTIAHGDNRDLTFHAEFMPSRVTTEEDQLALEDDSLNRRVILLGSIAVAAIVVSVLSIVFRKKLKRLFRRIFRRR